MRYDPDLVDPFAADGDFYDVRALLDDDGRALLARVRTTMAEQVGPLVVDHWARGEFPHEVRPAFRDLDIAGMQFTGHGCPGLPSLLCGLVIVEIASVDASMSTFLGVHSGLAIGSIMLCGSEEQKERFVPGMRTWERIGAFGLTEPEVGSGIAGGMTTTATREGDEWVLSGQKKWIGNGTFADVVVVWARDTDDDQVKGFLVQLPAPGFAAEKMPGKIALRTVQNAVLTLDGVRVPEADRLAGASSFRDTAKVLRLTRGSVAWSSVGCAIGAYRAARAHAMERHQFGRPIASFQLVQDLLARSLSNITASTALCTQLARLQDEGRVTEAQASLAKMECTTRCREVVQWCREIMGGDGILLENSVARHFVDAEALYSYEGTREMNALVVGRAVTGTSAFV